MKKKTIFLAILFLTMSWMGQAQVTSFPWAEGFEGTFLPNGWAKEVPGSANDITQNSSQSHTGSNSARFSSYSRSSDYNQYLFTEQIHITAPYTELKFWHKKSYSGGSDELSWGISTNGQASTDITTWTSVSLSTTWTEETIDLSAYDGQDIYIAWHYYGNYQYYVYLDDVSIDQPPSAYNPVATFTVAPDCSNDRYAVDVNVTDLGGAASVTVSDNQGNSSQLLAAGPVVMGPYPNGTTVDFTVTNDADANFVSNETITFYCPPSNDECDDAIALTVNNDLNCGVTTSGTNVGATQSSQPDDITGTPDDDVWFSFVATSVTHQISLSNVSPVLTRSTDMGMGLYDASAGCGSLVLVDDSDPNSFTASGLTIGTTYLLRVYGWYAQSSSAKATFDVCVGTPPPPPANNDCDDAIPLTLYDFSQSVGHEVTGDTTDATDSGAHPSCDTAGTNIDMFYTFLLPPGETGIRILTEGDKGSGIEAAIYDSCGGAVLACEGRGSLKVINGLTGGQQYTLQVWHDEGYSQGEFTIALEKLPTPPSNDICDNAWNLAVYPAGGSAGNETNEDTQYATDSGAHPSCAGSSVQDYFYSFTVPAGVTDVTLITGGEKGYKLGIAVYDSCGGAEVVCEEGSYFHVISGLTSGSTYTLQVWHSSTDKGGFNIALEVADVPVNDDCANAKIVPSLPYINIMDATFASGMETSCSSVMNDGVWYQFTGDGSDVTIVATPGDWDNKIAVYTGDCGSLSCEATKDSYGAGHAEELTFTSVDGMVYFVNIGQYSSISDKPEGILTIEISSEAAAISDNAIDGFNYYPNPVNNLLNLSAQNDIQNIMIFDMTGKEVMNMQPNAMDTQVDMSRLNPGMYFVKVRINNQLTAFKVVKE